MTDALGCIANTWLILCLPILWWATEDDAVNRLPYAVAAAGGAMLLAIAVKLWARDREKP